MKKNKKDFLNLFSGGYQLPPIISGVALLWFLRDIIFSKNISETRFEWSIIIISILFIASMIIYYILRKIEKDKDIYLISSIGKIVEDVFRHYGQMAVEKNAGMAKANDMNKIMQTIVNLVAKMKNLVEKSYKD